MIAARHARLDDRSVLALDGADVLPFLQGIVTNDVAPAADGRAVYAALLTPQGRFLHDFILVPADGRFLLDCERGRVDDLKRRLTMYRLRAKVAIEDVSDRIAVFAVFGAGAETIAGLDAVMGSTAAFAAGIACVDPRLAALGVRALLPATEGAVALTQAGLAAAGATEYRRLRMTLGVAEGAEIGADRTLALEAGFDALNGVSFSKGCYVGQEVTTRMHSRKLVKKRIVPVTIDGPSPVPGAIVMQDGTEAGEIRAVADGVGLALLRLESLARHPAEVLTTADGATIAPIPIDR